MSKLPQDLVRLDDFQDPSINSADRALAGSQVTEGSVETLGKVEGIDMETFGQILEMDEPDDPFSSVLVFDFFDQVTNTFSDMDEALEKKELKKLSDLGHYLKGSSATLGLTNLRDACEKIQRFGKQEKEDGTPGLEEDDCLKRIEETLEAIKEDFEVVEVALRNFYGEPKP